MRKLSLAACLLSLSTAASAIAADLMPSSRTVSAVDVESLIANWPPSSNGVARVMIEKYGQPDESTESLLIWRNNGVWKRSIVHRDEIGHNYPRAHMDVLEQVVDRRVPLDKYNELARFDGSVAAHRTRGELSSTCDTEESNFLALNLADEIIARKRSVEEARRFLSRTAKTAMAGKESDYTKGLLFETRAPAADPDLGPAPEFK